MTLLKEKSKLNKNQFCPAVETRTAKGLRHRLQQGRSFLFVIIIVLLIHNAWAAPNPSSQDKTLTVIVEKNSSLKDLIAASGYGIADEHVVAFRAEFMNLNPDVKSLNSLTRGTLVRVPVEHLVQISSGRSVLAQNAAPQKAVAAESGPPSDRQSGNTVNTEPTEKFEMGRFSDRETAEAFLMRLVESGYTGGIEQQNDSKGQAEYQVYVLLPFSVGGDTDSESLTWSILGKKGKDIHAAVTLTGLFTDNAFNTKANRKSDFSMFLTPEVWLNLPRTDKAVSYESVSPRSVGGHLLDTLPGERVYGYQASVYYRTDLPLITSNNSPYGSTATHKVAAGVAFIGNRFSLNVSDQLELSYQEREAGQIMRPDAQDRYNANRFSAAAAYDTRNRLIFSIDSVYFTTNYRLDTSEVFDRHDFGLTPAVRYRLTPKINLLVDYTYYTASYDNSGSLDSREQYLLGGLEWRLTEKSFGRLKAGYEVKDFKHGSDYKGFAFELQLDHRLTAKTQLSLSAFRKTNETRVYGTAFALSTGARLNLSHMITSKITAGVILAYLNDRNRGTYGGTSVSSLSKTEVNDYLYQAGIEVQYAFRRWLRARAEYLFTTKNSSESSYDYRSNTLIFGLTGSF